MLASVTAEDDEQDDDNTVEVFVETFLLYRYTTPCCGKPLVLNIAAWRDEDGDLCIDRSDAVGAMALHARQCR